MPQDIPNQLQGPFEGPEKLLEIWFKSTPADVPDAAEPDAAGRTGLRKVDRSVWEDMLNIVKCRVLSVIHGDQMDAYLLSESSLFVSPHRLILKTCGTTLNLLGLPRILDIAATHANMPSVYRCFYSRKAFMFPERQRGPHRDWKQEVQYLDNIFHNGAAYTVGKVNGDHWLLYMTDPCGDFDLDASFNPSLEQAPCDPAPDFTIEILMSELASTAREPFFSSFSTYERPDSYAAALSKKLGISDIFPSNLTTLDAYSFTPCGYSANALVKWNVDSPADCGISSIKPDCIREGYYTIHVTPEEGWSYASFECNVPSHPSKKNRTIPDLKTLIQRVVRIFKPGRLSLTLFISSKEDAADENVEAAQQTFKIALTDCGVACDFPGAQNPCTNESLVYKRTDKINYEFGGYELAFATFELRA